MKIIRISNDDIMSLLDGDAPYFPKYVTQILNLANQNAQGTRPYVVGQMSELIKEFKGNGLREWEEWYLSKHPEAITLATNRILEMINRLKEAIGQTDRNVVERWVKDLVIVKTFVGLKFQEAILKSLANGYNFSYRLADPEEEAKGIDGFVGNVAVSIKPSTYQTKVLQEEIGVLIVFYEKIKDGVKIMFDESFFAKR
jgi:hypothetical protein